MNKIMDDAARKASENVFGDIFFRTIFKSDLYQDICADLCFWTYVEAFIKLEDFSKRVYSNADNEGKKVRDIESCIHVNISNYDQARKIANASGDSVEIEDLFDCDEWALSRSYYINNKYYVKYFHSTGA